MAVTRDVVTLRTVRSSITGNRIITGFCIIGSAVPCRSLIVINNQVAPVRQCLLQNGFALIFARNGIFVFRRTRIVV
jgi:hypothetical protein